MASLFSVFKYVRPRKVIKSDDFNGLQDSIKASFDTLGTALTVLDPVGHLGVSTPFHVAAPVDNEHAATKLYVDTSYGTNAANLAAALVAQTAAEAAQAAADADAAATALDAAATAADKIATNADAATTAADVVTTTAKAAATTLDAAATALDAAATALDAAATAADKIATNADVVTTTAKAAATTLDAASTAADVLVTNADAAATALDAAATAADVVTVAGIYDSFDDRYLGVKAVDPTLDNDGNALLVGALYFDSTLTVMKVYNGTAWQSSTANAADVAYDNSTVPLVATDVQSAIEELGVRSGNNAIINANFLVNQEAVSGTVILAAGEYGHDMWKAGAGGCTYTFATSENVNTLTISAGSLQQVIEGENVVTDTYSLSWAGTAQGKIAAGSYSASGVTGSVTGGADLTVEFNTGTLSKVQLEQGAVVTAFSYRSKAEEESLCRRYFEVIAIRDFHHGWSSTTWVVVPFSFTPKRTTPIVSTKDTAGTLGAISCYTSTSATVTTGFTPATLTVNPQFIAIGRSTGAAAYGILGTVFLDARL